MKYVELRGTPRERGRQHGEALRDMIRNLSLPTLLGNRLDSVRDPGGVALRLEHAIQSVYPQAIDELRGITEGSGLPYQSILNLNLYYCFGAGAQCTYVGFIRPDGKAVLGKNEDASCRDILVMFRSLLPDGRARLMCTYAGILSASCGNGLASTGLAMAGASIGPVTSSCSHDSIPLYLLLTKMLEECATVGDCLQMLATVRYTGVANLAFADREGGLVGVEAVSGIADVFHYPKSGIIYRSNHPMLPSTIPLLKPKPGDEAGLYNSQKRVEVLEILTKQVTRDAKGLEQIFRNHNSVASICQHAGVNGAVMSTDGSFIMEPAELRMRALVGSACQNAYEEFQL